MNRILVVDDDRELCELLINYLHREGFEVEAAHNGKHGVEQALTGVFSLVVLDVMLPDFNGFDVLRKIRVSSAIPVLMLTARVDEVDRIVGLEMGADDYLSKPFNPRELVARIRAIQRRSQLKEKAEKEPDPTPCDLKVGDIEINPGTHSVFHRGCKVEVMTAVEFSILYELLKNAGRVVTRDNLAEKVLGRKLALFDRSVDVHISSLRKKLGSYNGVQERIKSIRGVGYQYLSPEEASEHL
jgi:two-component system response regulator CpxR